MPKRSFDASTIPADMTLERAQRKVSKTERSHEENQERAYIAASRRADRSIEARVQSARMASEIHKKRTGKGFKISEEIVMKEEMYEEEEDDLPRQYRALAAHLQTSSADMNSRLSAYLTNQVAMASLARQNEVNRMFAEQFPGAAKFSQQMAQSLYAQPLQQQQQQHQDGSPQFQQMSFGINNQLTRERAQSMAQSEALSPRQSIASPMNQPRGSIEAIASPPALSPGSPSSRSTPSFSSAATYPATTLPVDPSLAVPSAASSSFTVELPHEVKQMANIDPNDPMASMFFGNEIMPTNSTMDFMHFPSMGNGHPAPMLKTEASLQSDYGPSGLELPGQCSTIGTPGGGVGDNWDAWINDDWQA